MVPIQDPLLQAQRSTGEERQLGAQFRNSLEGTSHTGPLQVCPREGSGEQGQLPRRQNLCSAAGGIYILDIYSHWWILPYSAREELMLSVFLYVLHESVWLDVLTCVNIHECFCTHLLGAHAQAASGWTSPGLLDPALDTTILHHLPAGRHIPIFHWNSASFSKCVILSTAKIVSSHQICKNSICTASLAWCKSLIMDTLSITNRKLDLMFKHEQPFGRKAAVFPGSVLQPPQILCPFSRAANSWEALSNKEEWGSPAQCRSHFPAPLRRMAWGHRASSCQVMAQQILSVLPRCRI